MNITFLVGNGFDISAGIDTSYQAFYKWYCEQPSSTDIIEKFKQEIKDDINNGGETWADFEIGLGKYTRKFSHENVDEFFECYEDAHESIIVYLEQRKNQFNIDNISEEDITRLRAGLLNFYQELSPHDNVLFRNYFNTDTPNDTVFNFLSFNYTDVLDKCVKKISSPPLKQWQYGGTVKRAIVKSNVLHIHGTSNEYPVLGVNDKLQIANQKLLSEPQFCDIMIKPQSVASIGQLWHTDADKLIESSHIICIWGMSLGSSDSLWWNKINKWLKANLGRHLVVFCYTKDMPNNRSILKYNRVINQIKDLMMSYSGFSDSDIETIRNRIHVVLNTKSVLRLTLPLAHKVTTA